ncbi:acetylglutamate kinase [Sporosarcina soli]|uniref:Acetylglutamate kinase n=1 Tax=Sporosarcina soli TaxID=334736 RepID=A0ABW0TM02_9BACL
MTTSKSTQHTEHKRIVIKLGGSMLEGLESSFFKTFHEFQNAGYEIIIVHGGGPAINRELAKNGVTSSVVNGIRVTSKEAVSIVQATLVGQVNPFLVHQLNKAGIEAIGLSGYDGKLLSCTVLDEAVYGSVGQIQQVQTDMLEKLLKAQIVPVISCIGATADGAPLNINADTVASEIALAVKADSLLLVTDTPGIQINQVIQATVSPDEITQWVASGDIYGGMIPKVEAALACLQSGIPSVQIVGQQLTGTDITLQEVLA